MHMKGTIIFGIAAMLAIPVAYAHEDKYFVPNVVDWEIAPSESFSISVSEEGVLREVQYSWDGADYSVPSSEMEGIGEVDLRDVEVIGTNQSDIGRYRYIKIGIGGKYCSNTPEGCSDNVRFHFNETGYESRTIYRKLDESTTQIYNKYPGQNEKPGGK